jgi:TonB family protein
MSQLSSATLMCLGDWQQWEGRVVGGRYALRQYLGGSDHSAVYLTGFGGARAVAKLVPADTSDAPAQLARWEAACNFAHPNLLRVYETGRWHADDEQDMFFAVMESADENLGEILSERALTPAEVREMLVPALAALEYLHGRNLVHGCLKPSNVLATGPQLKLAIDGVRRSGTRLTSFEQEDWRAVPEVFNASVSSRNDIWALGLLLVESLTGKPPQSGDSVVQLPDDLPEPFRSIAQGCLQRDPTKRCSIPEIRKMLERPVELVRPTLHVMRVQPEGDHSSRLQGPDTVTQPTLVAEHATPAEAETASKEESRDSERNPQQRILELQKGRFDPADSESKPAADLSFLLDEEKPAKRGYKRFVPLALAILVAIVTLSALTRFIGRHSEDATAQPQPAGAAANSAHVQQTSASAPNPIARPVSGAVAQQVMPEFTRAAQNSIHGAVKVRVRVNANETGEVVLAGLATHGPSRYFARQALEAARQWKFAPPIVDGVPVASRWTIEFDFRRGGVKADPKMIAPRA